MVESPYVDFDDDFAAFARARSRSTGADDRGWGVHGRTVYEVHGTAISERARIGFGIGRCCRSGAVAVARSMGKA